MDSDERTFSTSQIRERRREVEQSVALQQRQLAALAKIDEGTHELEQVERELAALSRGETEPEQAAEASPGEPVMTGERAVTVMRVDHPDLWCDSRTIMRGFGKRGWIGDRDPELLIQSLRHSLRRLAQHNPHIERKSEGGKHYYRYSTHLDSDALVAVTSVNGSARPALREA